MRSWSNLPEEVLLIIFNSKTRYYPFETKNILDEKDIFQCELVCKNWKSPAQRVNYSTLTFDEHDTKNLIKAFDNNSNSAGKFVKELIISFKSQSTPWEHFLLTLVDAFPFIDNLEVHEPCQDFYSALITIRNRSKWKCLKRFECPNLDQDLEMYAVCALKYQTMLKHLLVCDKIQFIHTNSIQINDELYFTLLEELQQFPKMEELTIKRHTNSCLESFDATIEKCQKLKKLDIGIYTEFDNKITYSDIDLSLIATRPNIKILDGLFVIQNDNTLLYIMHKFSKLQDIFINHSLRDDSTENDQSNTTLSSITAATLIKFISYLSEIPSCAVSIYIKIRRIIDALSEYLRVSGPLLSFLSISYSNGYNYVIDPFMEHNAKFTMHRVTHTRKNQDHEFFIDYSHIADTLPHLDLIEKIGKSVKELTYRMHFDSLSKDSYKMIYGNFLDHIFKYCTNLIKLRLSSTELHQCNPTPCLNTSITRLVLLNCYIGKDILSQLSKRLVNLKYMVIVRCELAPPHDDLNPGYFHIDMSHTNFKNIRIKSKHYISLIMVKLSRGEQDQYFKLSLETNATHSYHTVDNSTQFAYESISNYKRNFKLYIKCSSVERIQLFTNVSVEGGEATYGEIKLL